MRYPKEIEVATMHRTRWQSLYQKTSPA
ncbi:hypothetical protein PSHT_08834 [Puccinia striiformis]|uniref:Uncharacterized protein n=1 Tax=Puccinia striiformis TaxID=27350 RepID=A0A2S4VL26_9BASI|nr:hypothetical protein PSHT_08834 [Puccinia striiformis]